MTLPLFRICTVGTDLLPFAWASRFWLLIRSKIKKVFIIVELKVERFHIVHFLRLIDIIDKFKSFFI